MHTIVFKDALIMDGNGGFPADLGIDSERIAAIGTGLSGKTEIPLGGAWVLPGALDVHTHMSLPFAAAISCDDFFTGTRAGAFGGVTTIIDFTAQKGDEGLRAGFQRRMGEAADRAAVDFSFHGCIGRLSSEVVADLPWAREAGLTSLKVFTAYRSAGLMMEDGALLETLKLCRDNEILTTVHAENGPIIDSLCEKLGARGTVGMDDFPASRPTFTEVEAVRRLAFLAREARAAVYIVHLSAGESADFIGSARAQGMPILAETCPQYLFLDESRLSPPDGHFFACCPPIRGKSQWKGLEKGLSDGHVQVVGTDHCPFTRAAKNTWGGDFRKIPMGLPGIETMPLLLLHGAREKRWPLDRAIRAFSANPARIFGLYPRKGCLKPGSDADLFVYDPMGETEISATGLHMATDYSPYEGIRLRGKILMTVSRGEIIVNHGEWKGRPGRGLFLKRAPFDPGLLKGF